MDDASLDEFLEGEGGDGDPANGPGDQTAESGDAPAPEPVDPAVTTYQWAPDGADCAVCGNSVERRFRAEAGLVCPDCKEW